MLLIARYTLALPRRAVKSVVSPGEHQLKNIASEIFGTAVTYLVLKDIKPGNMTALNTARQQFEHVVDMIPFRGEPAGAWEADRRGLKPGQPV